jgi:gamma-glutamylcyclotransferase (GGCT)/AIG2-like uncharacterized protein YtfP
VPVADDLIAFYGTLMTGLGGQQRLGVERQLEFVGSCVLQGTLIDIDWYPGLAREPRGRVVGELHRVRDLAVLDLLDRYEGYDPVDPVGSEYVRERVCTVEPGSEAWVYVLNRDLHDRPRIASGDWRSHARAKGLVP